MKNLIKKLLIKTQKLTETDNVYIAKHGFYMVMGNILSTIVSFLLAMAFAKFLPKEIYGDYRYVLSIMCIIGLFALPGMETAIAQATARGFEGSLLRGIKTKFKWALMGTFVSFIIAIYFILSNNPWVGVAFVVAGIFFPFMESSTSYLSFLVGKRLFKNQAQYSTLSQIISSFVLIVILFIKRDLILIVLFYFLSNTLLRIFMTIKTIKKYKPNKNECQETIPYGKRLSLLEIITTVSDQIDKIILYGLAGPIQVAVYSFSELPIRQINSFLRNLRLLALPKLAIKTKLEVHKTLLKKIGGLMLIVLLIVSIYIVFVPCLYKIFFPEYLESVKYSQILSLTLLAFPATIITLCFEAQMMKKEISQFTIFSPLFRIVLLCVFTFIWGIWGIVMAQLLSRLFDFILALTLFKKNQKLNS